MKEFLTKKQRRNSRSKRFSATLIIVVVCLFMVNFVSAITWDNVAYYKLDETSGTIVTDVTGNIDLTNNGAVVDSDGKINKGYAFDGDAYLNGSVLTDYTDGTNYSIGLWFNATAVWNHKIFQWQNATANEGAIVIEITDGKIQIGIPWVANMMTIPISTNNWYYLTLTKEENDYKLYLNGTLVNSSTNAGGVFNNNQKTMIGSHDGTGFFYILTLDEIAIWNRTINAIEVSSLWNDGDGLPYSGSGASDFTVTLDFPPNGILLSDVGSNFTANYSVINYNLTNSTYYLWKKDGATYDLFNSTIVTTFVDNQTTQFIDSFTLGKYKWNVYACAENTTSSRCEWAPSNYTFEVGASIDAESYSNSTYETTSETFQINISLLEDVILYEAILNYNNTNYTGTITDLGSNSYSLLRTINAPQVNQTTNIPWYWIFKYDDSGTTVQTTSERNQSILELQTIVITDGACDSGFFSAVFYNFYNAENLTNLNADVTYNFRFGIGNLTSMVVNGGYEDTSSLRICINETIDSYKLGYGEIQYNGDGYVDRRYYMYEGQPLSNSSQANHTLYLLPTADSTSFIFEFKNTFLNPYIDKLVALLRWYPDEDEYKVVEMAKTDDHGSTVMKVHTEDVDYRVGLYEKDGSLLKLAEPVRMACLVDPCTYTLKVIHDPVDFQTLYDIESSLTWDEDNNRFVYIYNDPDQHTTQMRLYVYKDMGFQEILICNDTATGYTGVLTCDIGNYTGSIIAKVYRSASPEWPIASLYHSVRDGIESSFGLFASFLIVLTTALIGVFSPIGAIVLLILGLIPAVFMGSITFAIFMGIGVLGGIVINIIKNYS